MGRALLVLAGVAAGTAGFAFRGDIASFLDERATSRAAAAPDPPIPAPVPTPSADPSTPAPPRGRLVIHGTGDVNLDPSYIPALAANGYGHAWSGLDGLFERDDLTVVNLECAVSELGAPIPDKEFTFRAPPEALAPMAAAGVEVANLANNHSGDLGPDALVDTRRNVIDVGIAPVGAGMDGRQAYRPAMFRVDGWKVAVLGFGGVIPHGGWLAGRDHPGMADGDSIPEMVAAVREAERRADVVVVTIHWGTELATTPDPEDVERAHALIRAGADAIFGHHAHRLQPLDTYRGRPIFWGLGNFVWPNLSHEGSTTAVAEVTVRPGGGIAGRLIPAYIESPGHPVLVD
ncbi:MAG TPA: CapA family protein [Actinomycetota bacterium]|nr:CapA family protein [Actinomycetota bacterium]